MNTALDGRPTGRVPLERGNRIHLLDELRGFDILLMVVFHWFYVLGWLLDVAVGRQLFLFFSPVQPLFAGMFIVLCGISCLLSRSNLRRGLQLVGLAAGISISMCVFCLISGQNTLIVFGILHFLAAAILLFAATPFLSRVPPAAGLIACAVLAALTWRLSAQNGGVFGLPGIPALSWQIPAAISDCPWLYPLGMGRLDIESVDYFPLLPWLFVFYGGVFFGRLLLRANSCPAFLMPKRIPALSWLGRRTLWIYVLHQPVFFGLAWVFLQLFSAG